MSGDWREVAAKSYYGPSYQAGDTLPGRIIAAVEAAMDVAIDSAMDSVLSSDRYRAFIEREQAHGASRERERIARAIEADRDAYCKPKSMLKGFARHGSIPAAWAWMSRAAAIARNSP